MRRVLQRCSVLAVLTVLLHRAAGASAQTAPERPFGTLREQAAMQQAWLKQRLDTFLPALMRKHGDRHVGRADARVQRGSGLLGDHRARDLRRAPAHDLRVLRQVRRDQRSPDDRPCVERIALGGTSQGGVFEARRSTKAAAGNVGRGQQAELWGDEQWQVLKTVIEERKPRTIGINRSTVFAFSDGLSSGELKGMSAALGETWTARFKDAEALPLELIAVAAARRRSVLPPHAGARLVDDADDVLEHDDHAGQDAHERSGLVVAAARQRPGARHVVPAERVGAAQGQDRGGDRRRSDHRARRRAPLRRRHHRRAAEHRHPAQRLRPAAGRDRRARRDCAARSPTPTRCRTS